MVRCSFGHHISSIGNVCMDAGGVLCLQLLWWPGQCGREQGGFLVTENPLVMVFQVMYEGAAVGHHCPQLLQGALLFAEVELMTM
jgi:hypothetical protein